MTRDVSELAEALAGFQAEVPVIPKKQSAQIKTDRGSYSYSYADLAAIVPVVFPLLAKHGLSFTCRPTSGKGDRGPVLVGMLMHRSGQYVTGHYPITGRGPQEIGSSLTYGRRYLLGCLTGVVTDDDDDGQAAQRSTRAPKRPSPGDVPVAPPIQRKPRGPAPEPGGSPHGSPEPGPDPQGTADPDRITDPQRRALFGAVGKALPDASRAERLALCSAIVGRPVQSSSDLGTSEASVILDWLDGFRTGWNGWTYDPETETGRAFRRDPEEPPPTGDPWP